MMIQVGFSTKSITMTASSWMETGRLLLSLYLFRVEISVL